MKPYIFLLSIFFPGISISAEDVSQQIFLEEANKAMPRINEATQGKILVQQIEALNDLSQEYAGNYVISDLLLQQLGTTYSFAGQHHNALSTFDSHRSSNDSPIEDVKTLHSKDAITAILENSDKHQIVMINEAHHVAQHRVLTYRLLDALWDKGFRYFAAETFTENVSEMVTSDYLPVNAGYYTKETIFANMVLHAKKLGFQLVSYDYGYNFSGSTSDREQNAAQHIQEKIFSTDPDAKVLIHVGYSHINEEEWLAYYLKLNLDLNPLTIDQVSIAEKSEPEYEPETYKWIVEDMLITNPIVLVDTEETIWSSDSNKYDISVIWPRTLYEFDRPDWASLGREGLRVNTQWCHESFPCTIEVFRYANDDEVPLDRTVITSPEEESAIFISEGSNLIIVTGSDGQQVFKQTINH